MSSVSNGDRLRAMYQGGRANTSARRYAKAWSTVFGPGLVPRRWVTLDWWRWIAASMIALILLLVLAVGLFIKLQPSPAPLALPVGVTPPQGPVNGIWSPAKGSVAGFRVQESALGFSNEVVGRTNGVTGTIAISGSRVTAATLRIDLATLTVSGKTQPQFATSLDTAQYPVATFTLAQPVTLSPDFASGAIVTARSTGHLALRGVSRLVTFSITGRRDGTALEVAGSIPVAFSVWGIKEPYGFGFLGSLADHGVAEFLVVLHRG